jgi:hypothetical protein
MRAILAQEQIIRINSLSMMRKWWFVVFFPLVFLAGCREPQGSLRGPVPAIGTPENGLASVLGNLEATNVSLADLLENPGAYKDQYLRVTGIFRRQQTGPCEDKFLPSPATWLIGSGGLEMPAAGPSDQVPDLPDDETQITVEGQWRRWIGLAGCGDEAIPAEVWYLKTSEIIFPEEVSLIPFGTALDEEPLVASEGPPVSSLNNSVPTATLEGSGEQSPAIPNTPAQPGTSPTAQTTSPAADLTPTLEQESPTAIPTLTSTGETITSTPGLTTGTAVPTVTTSPTTGGTDSPVSMPTLNLGSLEIGQFQGTTNHLWPYVIPEDQVITLQIAPEPNLGVAVNVNDPNGQMIVEEGSFQASQALILTDIPLTEPGTYEILVSTAAGSSGNYAILVGDEESYNFVFRGFLEDGDSFDAEMAAESDHFWHFTGQAGEVINIVVTPNDVEDLFLRLFGSDGNRLVEFHDLEAGGEAEELVDYSLPETGLYSLLVGENDFESAEYSIEFFKG